MKIRVSHLLALCAALFISLGAEAQTVRGKIMRATPAGPYPAAYVSVTLYSVSMGRSMPAYTTPEGFYYLYNVPPGPYLLEIWTSQRPVTSNVVIAPNRPLTDIAPIVLR